MTSSRRTIQDLVTRAAFIMAVVALTATAAIASQSVAPARRVPPAQPAAAAQPAPPASPATAAQPAPAAAPAPAARPAPRALPSRSVKLEVTLTPVAATVAGASRVLTVTMAEGRYAKFRRQGPAAVDHFSLDATSTIVGERQVLVEFNLSANASDRSDAKEAPGISMPNVSQPSAGIVQEGSVLLTPGVKQRVTQLDDSGGRPNLHVEMLVEIVK